MKRIALLVIDPQHDFCDLPGAALPVQGADADLRRLAAFIDREGQGIASIHVTLDSHHPLDIAHPTWWRDAAGDSPAPFTIISAADVASGRWRARDPAMQAKSADYVATLAASGRYALCVWPEHCLIGSPGHAVHADVQRAVNGWARSRLAQVDFVFKGTNPTTEHYSAVRAEVPDPRDPSTAANTRLVAALAAADEILVAGEALSHCVANTVRDLAAHLDPAAVRKLVLLRDATSPVAGFEGLGEAFLDEMTARGMRLATTRDYRATP